MLDIPNGAPTSEILACGRNAACEGVEMNTEHHRFSSMFVRWHGNGRIRAPRIVFTPPWVSILVGRSLE